MCKMPKPESQRWSILLAFHEHGPMSTTNMGKLYPCWFGLLSMRSLRHAIAELHRYGALTMDKDSVYTISKEALTAMHPAKHVGIPAGPRTTTVFTKPLAGYEKMMREHAYGIHYGSCHD